MHSREHSWGWGAQFAGGTARGANNDVPSSKNARAGGAAAGWAAGDGYPWPFPPLSFASPPALNFAPLAWQLRLPISLLSQQSLREDNIQM